jgi:hypothetical protein
MVNDQKLTIINMAKLKRFVLYLIAIIFTIFLTLKYFASVFLVHVFGKVPLKVVQSFNKINSDIRVKTKENKVN